MRKICIFLLSLLISINYLTAQTSVQTFGDAVGVHASGVSTSFIPNPIAVGTTYARIGAGGGTINLQAPLVSPAFGNEIIVRGEAPTTASVNKITPILNYTASQQFYTRFNMLLGNSVGGNAGATDGTWFFFQGDGANFSDANAFTGAQMFTGLQFAFGAGGTITTSYRNAGAWTSLGAIISQGNTYTVEIMGNNTAATINYTYGVAQSVASNTFDLWINGSLIGNDLAKAQLPNLSNIASLMFYGISSTANAANIFLDNISVNNSIPASICNTINAPTAVTATPANICAGDNSNLNATSVGNIINWYTQSVGGIALGNTPSGVNFSVTPAVTTKYYAEAAGEVLGSPVLFGYTGASQTYTVPAGVTSVQLECWGAQGNGGNGGNGGYARGTMTVTPGQVLNIFVGGQTAPINTAGFNGGGVGYAATARNGGGASDVRSGGVALVDRVIVAGGGGASCGDANYAGGTGGGGIAVGSNFVGGGGGAGYGGAGGAGGASGGAGNISCHAGGAGGGGLNSGGLASCNTCYTNTCGTPGTLGVGGNGDTWENGICYSSYGGTAGGGGGYFGGGGSSTGNCGSGGGGGGSSWTGTLTNPFFTAGIRTGNGQVVITPYVPGCPSIARNPVTVTVNPIPTVSATATPSTICLGENTNLSASGATTYTWNPGGLLGANQTVSPITTTVYTVTGTGAGGCTSTSTVTVTVNTIPVVTTTATPTSICAGSSSNISASGATTYTWDPGALVGANQTVSPLVTTIYTVTGTGAGGCTSTSTVTVTVNPIISDPSPVTATPSAICAGGTSDLSATSLGNMINWYTVPVGGVAFATVASGTNVPVSPAVTTTYYAEAVSMPTNQTFGYTGGMQTFTVPPGVTSITVDMRGAQGGGSEECGNIFQDDGGLGGRVQGTLSVTPGQVLNIYVGQKPSVALGIGQPASFNGGGASGQYAGAGGGATDIRIGGVALADRVAVAGGGGGGNTGCPDHGTGGAGGGLNGGDGISLQWAIAAGGATQFAGGIAGTAPSQAGSLGNGGGTGAYHEAGGGGGYYGGGSAYAAGAGGGSSYLGSLSGATTTAGYQSGHGELTLSWAGGGAGCPSNRVPVTVTVNSLPIVTATATPSTICSGETSVLSGTGAASYGWEPGALTGSPTVSPMTTTTYTLTGTDGNGCTASSTASVTVNPTPTATITQTPAVLACGDIPTLSAPNGMVVPPAGTRYYVRDSDPWSSSNNTDAMNAVFGLGNYTTTTFAAANPATVFVPGTQFVFLEGSDGNASSLNSYLLANLPTIENWVNAGGRLFLNAAPNVGGDINFGFGGVLLNYNNGQGSVDYLPAHPIVLGPSLPTGTSYTGTSYSHAHITGGGTSTISSGGGYVVLSEKMWGSGMVLFGGITSPIWHSPNPNAQNIWQNIIHYTANSAQGVPLSYVWQPGGATTQTITANASGVYTVTVTQGSCSSTATIQVTLLENPVVTASITPATTCENTVALPSASATGGVAPYTITWTAPLVDNTPFVAAANATYTATATDANGCIGTSTAAVTVNPASGTLAPATSNQSQDHGDDFDINYYDASCDLIATVDDGAGGNILGLTTATVNVMANAGTHNGQPYVRRWYQITPTNNGAADVVLYINQSDFDDYNAAVLPPYLPLPTTGNNADPNIANIRITKNDDAGLGNNPIVITPAVNWNGTYWELSFNTPSFSQFRVHSVNPMNIPLPATITQFSGVKMETSDKLMWSTSSEQNNAYFNLQHSTDGKAYSTIAKVNSKAPNGNSQVNLNYVSYNEKPVLGKNYYRLQQVDIDNNVTIHNEIVITNWGADGSVVSLYPNPTSDVLNIDLQAVKSQMTTVKVMDMSGRVVKQIDAKTVVGMNNIKVNLGEFANGMYTVQVLENNQLTYTGKVRLNK